MLEKLEKTVSRSLHKLISDREGKTHWCFPCEGSVSVTCDYIFMMHFTGFVRSDIQDKMANYIQRNMNPDGGWPLFPGGASDPSSSVKSYYALILSGRRGFLVENRSSDLILMKGGASEANVFTKIMLAQFGQIPWRDVPYLPVEMMLVPKASRFHISKLSHWSQVVLAPLLLLYTDRVQAINPTREGCRELFLSGRPQGKPRSTVGTAMCLLDRAGSILDPYVPKAIRGKAREKTWKWIVNRLSSRDGFGAIAPSTILLYEALLFCSPIDNIFKASGIGASRATGLQKIFLESMIIQDADEAYLQPTTSPVWDTAISVIALEEANKALHGTEKYVRIALDQATAWLAEKQLPNGAWAFQYDNPKSPDVDDTAMCNASLKAALPEYDPKSAESWMATMISKNGGFGAFSVDCDSEYLSEMPFADHEGMIDPPTSDITGRVLWSLKSHDTKSVDFLVRNQKENGAWEGRWGSNYLWGTWSAVIGLKNASRSDYRILLILHRVKNFLLSTQNTDGGWGESCNSYHEPYTRPSESTAFHTAIALLTFLEIDSGDTAGGAVDRGVSWLIDNVDESGSWTDTGFNAPAVPRFFYLKYNGYAKYFPVWALSKYLNSEINNGG